MKEEDYITGLSRKAETKMTTCNSLNIMNGKLTLSFIFKYYERKATLSFIFKYYERKANIVFHL